VHDIAAFKFVKVVSSTVIGWVWQFTLQSAQRHNQISKLAIFSKKSVSQVAGSAVFSIVWCSKCTIPNSLLKSDLHVFFRAGCSVWAKNFRQKLRVPPLVDPRAVEMNIFADLTISKRQKRIFKVRINDWICGSEIFLTVENP
jgi:hypothetical protein